MQLVLTSEMATPHCAQLVPARTTYHIEKCNGDGEPLLAQGGAKDQCTHFSLTPVRRAGW